MKQCKVYQLIAFFEGLARYDGQSNKDPFASIGGVVANGGLTVAKKNMI
jgi:hypothetical protein